MHEVFLQRCAAHPTLRTDVNFKVFLEYDQDVSATNIRFIWLFGLNRNSKVVYICHSNSLCAHVRTCCLAD